MSTEESSGQAQTVSTASLGQLMKLNWDTFASTPSDTGGDSHGEDATATVKLALIPSGHTVTMAFSISTPLQTMRVFLAKELKVPTECLNLLHQGSPVEDQTSLSRMGVEANGMVELEVESTDPQAHPLDPTLPPQDNQVDVITVRIPSDQTDGPDKEVVVEIERSLRRKRYLGGFRHKLTGQEFHNASNQTPRINTTFLTRENASTRDTQTVELRHQRLQNFNDTSTQMTGVGVYVSVAEDKLLIPGPYTTAEEHAYSVLQKIIIIQKYYRRWLAKRRVSALWAAKRKREEWEKAEELRKQTERRETLEHEFQSKVNPRTKEDFDLLYAALEKWRLEQLELINQTKSGAERKAALCMLLEQETDLLAAIERHKLEAGTEQIKRCVQTFLNKAAAPKKFRAFDGKQTKMVTMFTLRAKELRDIYNTLTMKYLTQDERLDILLTLKHTVREHPCKLTGDIIELIDREADLLMRGVKEENLMGLRKRITTLFLQYIKTPTFNPEAANHVKNIFYCSSCAKYLPPAEFPLCTNTRSPGHCGRCLRLDNIARPRLEMIHFTRMLKTLRTSEELYQDDSQLAFIMQERDIRYLVEYFWDGQSTLSAWKDLHDLVLVRWDRSRHWSPWNTILLTRDEAESHAKIEDLKEVYGEYILEKTRLKHTLAFKYFSQLPRVARMIRDACINPSVEDPYRYLHYGKHCKPTQIPEREIAPETSQQE